MNILTDTLPTSLEINDVEYPIRSDFRTALKTIMAFEDNELTGFEKQSILLGNIYEITPLVFLQSALDKANWFLNGGQISEEDTEEHQRVYSFSKDANFIFAAFRQTHGINLQTADLHWWEFLALFMDLGSETTFSSLIGLRKRVQDGTASKEERTSARAMGDMFYVPQVDTRTLDEKEKEAEFMRLIGGV